MELFSTYVNVIAVVAIIAGLAGAAWYVMALHWVETRRQEAEVEDVELPGDIHETITGIPIALIVFYAMIGVALVAYLIYITLGGIVF